MNKVIKKKNIKYIKLFLISPALEIIINIVYIVSFLILATKYTDMGHNFSNYEITKMTETYFEMEEFKKIETDDQFINYLEKILKTLYTFDPNKILPLLIPSDGVRMTKYTNPKESCSEKIDFTTNCSNDFACSAEALYKLYQTTDCGKPYYENGDKINTTEDAFSGLVPKIKGEYSSYDLFSGGFQLDLTIDEFNADQDFYKNWIKDKDLKFLVLQFNLYIPSNGNYVNIIAGVEMINYFSHVFPIFSITVYSNYNPNDALFISVFVFYSTAVILNIIKLLYEANVKCIISVHTFAFFNEALNLLLLIFTCFFLNTSKNIEYTSSKEFHSHLPLISIRKYIIVILAMTMLCIPFRIISLASWAKTISRPFVKYVSIIYRMLPGMMICFFLMGLLMFMFALMNYTLYNEVIFQYSDIYNSFLAIFNFQIINDLINRSKIYHSLSHSSYYVIFNLFQLLSTLCLYALMIGSICYLFKRSSKLEEEKVDDEVMQKLEEIEDKLKEGKEKEDNDLRKLKKQILWLNLSNKNDTFSSFSSKNELLLFKTSNQIISFLKYLFAIKPELQFKNLDKKFGIIIEIKNEKMIFKETELDQIEILVDWLVFVGCKIPVAIFTQMNLEKTMKMKLSSTYSYIRFLTDTNDLSKFVIEKPRQILITYSDKFSIMNHQVINYNSSKTVTNYSTRGDKTKLTAKSNINNASRSHEDQNASLLGLNKD